MGASPTVDKGDQADGDRVTAAMSAARHEVVAALGVRLSGAPSGPEATLEVVVACARRVLGGWATVRLVDDEGRLAPPAAGEGDAERLAALSELVASDGPEAAARCAALTRAFGDRRVLVVVPADRPADPVLCE